MITKFIGPSIRSQNLLKLIMQTFTKSTKTNPKSPVRSTIYFCVKSKFSNSKKKKIFSPQQQEQSSPAQQTGTQYTNWILARSQNHNHDISHLKRKFLKDRFSIHKLTNIKFLCALANHKTEYTLNTNEKIVLLAQLNHVFNILGKDKRFYNEFGTLCHEISQELRDPQDLVCLGTFLSTLANIGDYRYDTWLAVMDSLLVKKSDEQYDEIFGIVSALTKYKQQILELTDFHQTKSNAVLQFIPVIYRNHLQLIRQFIKFNIYNIKQCRIIFRCLYLANINEKYFWRSMNDWFNIYMKQQVAKKNLQQFFIINEKTIEKVINDDGMIRPRPILQQLTEIVYIMTQSLSDTKGFIKQRDRFGVRRFMQFVEDLVMYSIDNGSALYVDYLDNYQNKEETIQLNKKQPNAKDDNQSQTQQQQQLQKLNQQFQTKTEAQAQRLKLMQRSYKNVFINPIQIKNQSVIQLLVMMRKCCGYESDGNIPQQTKQPNQRSQKHRQGSQNLQNHRQDSQHQQKHTQRQGSQKVQFTRPQHLIDVNVLKWLVVKLCKDQMRYTIAELLQIVASEDFLKFARINLDELIVEKLKWLRSSQVTLKDLKKLMMFIDPSKFMVLKPILLNFLNKSHPSQIYELTRIIQMQSVSLTDEQYSPDYPRKPQPQRWLCHLSYYFLALPEQTNRHYKYFSFQQNCYFLYYLLKNQVYWQAFYQQHNYLGQMEKLKESVKIASYSRGFKLHMNSYFYRLLNYVDLVEFFEGGNVP